MPGTFVNEGACVELRIPVTWLPSLEEDCGASAKHYLRYSYIYVDMLAVKYLLKCFPSPVFFSGPPSLEVVVFNL